MHQSALFTVLEQSRQFVFEPEGEIKNVQLKWLLVLPMDSDASTDHVIEVVSRPNDLIGLEGFEVICHLVEIEPNKLDIHCLKQLGS